MSVLEYITAARFLFADSRSQRRTASKALSLQVIGAAADAYRVGKGHSRTAHGQRPIPGGGSSAASTVQEPEGSGSRFLGRQKLDATRVVQDVSCGASLRRGPFSVQKRGQRARFIGAVYCVLPFMPTRFATGARGQQVSGPRVGSSTGCSAGDVPPAPSSAANGSGPPLAPRLVPARDTTCRQKPLVGCCGDFPAYGVPGLRPAPKRGRWPHVGCWQGWGFRWPGTNGASLGHRGGPTVGGVGPVGDDVSNLRDEDLKDVHSAGGTCC